MQLSNFQEFLQTYYSYFKVDEQCHRLVKVLHSYAIGDEKLEKKMPPEWEFEFPNGQRQTKLSLRKGILLFGSVGTGKTDLLRLLNLYNRYLNSPYQFRSGVVWKFADDYRDSGGKCFEKIERSNHSFDELCLTDMQGVATKERAQYMGNWVMAGEEIIRIRYEDALPKGFRTHFTTNESIKKLYDIYGERSMSRLAQMCNFIPLLGRDRRFEEDPVIHQDFQRDTFQPAFVSQKEDDTHTKELLDQKLHIYKTTGSDKAFSKLDFDMLKTLGVPVCKEEELRSAYLEVAIKLRGEKLNGLFDKDSRRRYQMHRSGQFDQDEQGEILLLAKHLALLHYAQAILKMNRTSFFGQ